MSPAMVAINPFPEWGLGGGIEPKPNGELVMKVINRNTRNESNEEITLNDAYLVSGITGERHEMKIHIGPEDVAISEIGPIPPGAPVSLTAEFYLSETEFMSRWGKLYTVYQINGRKPERELTEQQTFAKMFDGARPARDVQPRVTRKQK
jgi:hypothetical protein